VAITIGRLSVEGGEARIDDARWPLAVEAQEVTAVLAGGGTGVDFVGRVTADAMVLELPGADAAGGEPLPVAVSARLRLGAGGLELEDVRLRAAQLTATVHGVIGWGEEPEQHLEVEAEGSADLLRRLGYLAADVELDGSFTANARLDVVPAGWELTGDLASPRLLVAGRTVRQLEASLRADEEVLAVEVEQARYAGGSLAGPIRLALADQRLPVTVDLTAEELDLATVLADSGLALERLAARVSGELTYRFESAAPLAGDGWAQLRLSASELAGRSLPVVGTASLTVRDGLLVCQASRLRAPGQRLEIEGLRYDLASGRGRSHFSLVTEDLGQLAELVVLPEGEERPFFWPRSGGGRLAGDLTLTAEGPVVDLDLELAGVTTPAVAVDHVEGGLRLTPQAVESLRLQIDRDGGALLLTGRIALAEDAGAANLTVDAASWPLADVAAVLEVSLPLDGPVSGRLELTLGADGSIAGSSEDLVVAPASVAGLAFDRLAAELTFSPERLTVRRAVAESAAGTVRARGSVGLGEAGTLEAVVEAPELRLDQAPLAALSAAELGGRLALSATLGGSLEQPRADLELAASELTLGDQALGEAELDVHWADAQLEVEGSLLNLVDVHGGGRLTPEEMELELAVEGDDLAALVELVAADVAELGGSFAGTLSATGSPSAPQLALTLPQLAVSWRERRFNSLEPVRLTLAGDTLRVESLFVGEERGDGELFVFGDVELGGEQRLDLRTQASMSAAWLEVLTPETRLRGRLNALGKVGGTLTAPVVDGQADLQKGQVILPGFPHSLDGLSATVLAYPDQLVLDNLSGRLGGGTVRAAGTLSLETPATQGPLDFRLQATAENVRLRYPEGWVLDTDAELVLTSAAGAAPGALYLLRGTVDLERADYLADVPVNLFQLTQGLLRRQRLEVGLADEWLASVGLNLFVNAPGTLRVRNNVADLEGQADLVVRGTLARPAVLGEVSFEPGSELLYGDTEYDIERFLVTFNNPDRIEPVIDLSATSRISEYQVVLSLSGTVDRLNADFTSDPPLPGLSVLALVATGEALSDTGPVSAGGEIRPGAGGTSGAERFLFGQAASAVSSRVKALFGFDKFRIDPTATAGDSVSSARLTVGKQISRDLYVTYSRDPASNESDVVQAEWRVAPGFVLVFTSTNGEDYAVDARWDRRF
jgi:autotransporter translocation and assembly factor TamB